jgi:hypothetical protein
MEQDKPRRFFRSLGMASIAFGILGAAFFWWAPLGMVLALTGVLTGLVGWIDAVRKSKGYRFAVVGTILSTAAFILGLVIALGGWELIQLQPYR